LNVLKYIDKVIYRIISIIQNIHLKVQIIELKKQGSIFGKNVFIDPTVKFRIDKNSRLLIYDNVKILNDSWVITDSGDEIKIGTNVFISQHVIISGNVNIGDDTLIAGYVSIIDANHNFNDTNKKINEQGGNKLPVKIGNNVWIGTHSVILQGVTVGNNSIIGANSTVTSDVADNVVVTGNPAKTIKQRE
jgi:acetyltransferase-like isoleucine patch superfamily enzyme